VRVLYQVPPEEAPAISYPLAVMRNRPDKGLAIKVEDCLTSPEALEVFRSRGFIVRTSAP